MFANPVFINLGKNSFLGIYRDQRRCIDIGDVITFIIRILIL